MGSKLHRELESLHPIAHLVLVAETWEVSSSYQLPTYLSCIEWEFMARDLFPGVNQPREYLA